MRTSTPSLDQFFRVLVEEVRAQKPSYEKDSFTVAEIYQSLIPYRTHRDRLGIEMNGDYEDALLRLLGGESEFLVLESDTARERIRLELRSTNPNTGLYREYAAVGVHLNPDRIPVRSEQDEDHAAERQRAGAAPELTLDGLDTDEFTPPAPLPTALGPGDSKAGGGASGEGGKASAAPSTPHRGPRVDATLVADSIAETPTDTVASVAAETDAPPAGKPATPPVSGPAEGVAPKNCPDCASNLPARDNLRFCPFCGTNVFVMPCGECGEVLERNWQFCIACGAEAA